MRLVDEKTLRLDVEVGLEDYEESKYGDDGYGERCGEDCWLCMPIEDWLTFIRAQDVYPLPVLSRPLLKAA